MNRLFLKVAAPALLIGFALSAACLTAAWLINRTQRELARLLPENVSAVEHAQQLEIQLRELRFLLLQQRLRPTPTGAERIDATHAEIERAINDARAVARDPRQAEIIDRIDREYRSYRAEEEQPPRPFHSVEEVRQWTEDHPVADATVPCRELLEVNNAEMRDAVARSDRVSRWVQAGLVLFCLLGPIGGFFGGFGTARGMSHSISRMLVLVRDVHAQLDEEVGLLDVGADPSLALLDERLEQFVERVRDVTRQVQQQQQDILRAEQLAAVGQLAAGVAHEIRNPLMGMKLLVESARRRGEGLTANDLTVMYREIIRLEQTAQGLLDFARPPRLDLQLADLRQAVLQALELARPRARLQEVDVELALPDAPVMLRHDSDQIAGIITNLMFNALDALSRGGHIWVTVTPRPGGGGTVTVRDSGPGIPPHLFPRLFIPFTSTKLTGTGLGLSVSRRTARLHGGDLTVVNDPAGGACFTLVLPAAPPKTGQE